MHQHDSRKPPDPETVRAWLQAEAAATSVHQLARRLGVGQPMLNRFIVGDVAKPSGANWERLVALYRAAHPPTVERDAAFWRSGVVMAESVSRAMADHLRALLTGQDPPPPPTLRPPAKGA